jgi:antitoxin (DNA-binding transcriptional repressor) of toxin-antitoxin stability system
MNKVVTIEEARETLAELAEAIGAGERVVVTKDGVPVFDLVLHAAADEAPTEEPKGGINWQALEDYKKKHGGPLVTWIAEDFDAPMTDEEFLEIFEPGK